MPGKGEIMERWKKKIKNKQYGQAMVEFALTLPIFLLAVIGVIELSRFFLVYSSVYTASREAARFGSSVGDNSAPNFKNCNQIRIVAEDSGFFGGVSSDDVIVYYEKIAGTKIGECGIYEPKLGDRIIVVVDSIYKPLLVGMILPDGIQVSAKNGRTIMQEIEVKSYVLPEQICSEDIYSDKILRKDKNKDKVVYVEVANESEFANYQLTSILYKADNLLSKNFLTAVYWDGDKVWSQKKGDVTPEFEIENLALNTSNLPAGITTKIEFEYKFPVPDDFSIEFVLSFVNAGNFTNACQLSIDQEGY